ncbi:MAG: LamG domain-containing protein [Candidatus Brocadiia bacterium]
MRQHKKHQCILRVTLAIFLFFLVLSSPVFTADTAFWEPYEPDKKMYALLHFDDKELSAAEGKIKDTKTIGDATYEQNGRFGGALRVSGSGSLRAMPSSIFPGGFISVEAWIKLEKTPQKRAYVVQRPARVDRSAKYNPQKDLSKGFSLYVDSKRALHFTTTNCGYGRTVRTSSGSGAVPVGKWVHVAGVSAVFPVKHRRIYVNGEELRSIPITWGKGIVVHREEEKKPTPLYIGNSEKGDAGLIGLIDEVRVHRNIFRFWPREDMKWAEANDKREIPDGPPYFVEVHRPQLHLSLDGDTGIRSAAFEKAKVRAEGKWIDRGVRKQAHAGKITVSASKLLDLEAGSVEFWMRPLDVNNISDRNVGFMRANNAFTFYIFNGGRPGRPLCLYFRKADGSLHFVKDGLGTEVRPGAWYHIVISWKRDEICLYINGRRAARSTGVPLAQPRNKGSSSAVSFNTYATHTAIDEVYVYGASLMPEEVANAYWRYLDPGKLSRNVKLAPVDIEGMVLPSHNQIFYRLRANIPPEKIKKASVSLRNKAGKELVGEVAKVIPAEQSLEIPELEEGIYHVAVLVTLLGQETEESDVFTFVRKSFPWEDNELGISRDVYPPFESIKVKDLQVKVVDRTYRINAFGLWDSIVSRGRELLAEPIRLRYATADGGGKWRLAGEVKESRRAAQVSFETRVESEPVIVETNSSIEVDGCMKVEMKLAPGPKPAEIQKLWVEIPLKTREVPLMHTVVDSLRINHSGRIPEGQGVIWTGEDARRRGRWLNSFVPYVWLGAEKRGLAWFAENDKGWFTGKNKNAPPVQEIVRDGEKTILKVYLVNTPSVIKQEHRIVFGLQASPTKPMPEDWRAKLPHIPGGLAVVPWGGLHCSYQTPYRNDWRIVDKIVEARRSGKVDREWFAEYDREHNPPPPHGTWSWLDSVLHFAGRAKGAGINRPIAVYQEEMAASRLREEWLTYGDEWTTGAHAFHEKKLSTLSEDVLRSGANANPSHKVTFVDSYRDFGCWVANDWLKRGVSLYWDNTYPHISYNYRTTAAYRTEKGRTQPCTVIWGQREYQKRVWNLLQKWRQKREEPLEWTLHMTNTLLLPVHTWGTADLDHELGSKKPFAPAWLRTETIGRQIGNYPLSLYPVSGRGNPITKELDEKRRARVEWGMRAVHEIQRQGNLEKVLTGFGYATEQVKVHNYWEEDPALVVDASDVKWLLLEKTGAKEIMIVLASWSEKKVKPQIRVNARNLSFQFGGSIFDAESGEMVARQGTAEFQLPMAGPYGVRILRTAK